MHTQLLQRRRNLAWLIFLLITLSAVFPIFLVGILNIDSASIDPRYDGSITEATESVPYSQYPAIALILILLPTLIVIILAVVYREMIALFVPHDYYLMQHTLNVLLIGMLAASITGNGLADAQILLTENTAQQQLLIRLEYIMFFLYLLYGTFWILMMGIVLLRAGTLPYWIGRIFCTIAIISLVVLFLSANLNFLPGMENVVVPSINSFAGIIIAVYLVLSTSTGITEEQPTVVEKR